MVALGLGRRRPRRALAALVVVAGANLSTVALKAALAQPRYQPLLGWYQIGETSFPSGHATAVAAITYGFALVVPPRLAPATLVAGAGATALVGGSALVLHWHYASDVAGGVLVASFWFFATVAGGRALGPRGVSLPSRTGSLRPSARGRRPARAGAGPSAGP
jgi:membrane-associated phospholipid phosphatase